jgi:nitrite reductase/ring-hydroxylating ferredoxin subunit
MTVLCRITALADGAARGVAPDADGQDTMFLIRRGALVFAYRDSCPHWPGARMAWRRHEYLDASGTHIVCHGHGARFDIETGECLSGPCVGQSLTAVPVELSAGGTIRLLLPPCKDNKND